MSAVIVIVLYRLSDDSKGFSLNQPVWTRIDNERFGLLNGLSASFSRFESLNPGVFPDLRHSDELLIASDYGRAYKPSLYHVYSFLLLNRDRYPSWDQDRIELRERTGLRRRTMSYKNLGDKYRRRALLPFLEIVGRFHGLSITVAVDSAIRSLFTKEGAIDFSDPAFVPYAHWKEHIFERLLRIIHIISFLVAGLSTSGQTVRWITDNDPIVPDNEMRIKEVEKIGTRIMREYVPHQIDFEYATAQIDDGTKNVEDLVAIPDLITGTITEIAVRSKGVLKISNQRLVLPDGISQKARSIENWIASPSRLQNIIVVLTLDQKRQSLDLQIVSNRPMSDGEASQFTSGGELT